MLRRFNRTGILGHPKNIPSIDETGALSWQRLQKVAVLHPPDLMLPSINDPAIRSSDPKHHSPLRRSLDDPPGLLNIIRDTMPPMYSTPTDIRLRSSIRTRLPEIVVLLFLF